MGGGGRGRGHRPVPLDCWLSAGAGLRGVGGRACMTGPVNELQSLAKWKGSLTVVGCGARGWALVRDRSAQIRGTPTMIAYVSSKAAIIAMTKTASKVWPLHSVIPLEVLQKAGGVPCSTPGVQCCGGGGEVFHKGWWGTV